MNGTGPRPVAKNPTKAMTDMADKILISQRRDSARQRDMEPMPAMERRRQALRPILSARGAHAMVVMRLTKDIPMVRRDDLIGRRPSRRETEYIMIELTPQNCWANMIPMTAMIAGRYKGLRITPKNPTWGTDFEKALLAADPRLAGLDSVSCSSRSSSSRFFASGQCSISSAIELSLPLIRCNVRTALCGSLCAASQAGLSGTKNNPSPCMRPIPAPTPSMILHIEPLLLVRKNPSVCVTRIPMLIVIWVILPNRPLSLGGAISDMYNGTITVEAPAPTPASNLPINMIGIVPAMVSRPEPRTKKQLVMRIESSRP